MMWYRQPDVPSASRTGVVCEYLLPCALSLPNPTNGDVDRELVACNFVQDRLTFSEMKPYFEKINNIREAA